MANNQLVAFLQELLQRLFTKSPLFFKIWSSICALMLALSGLPALFAALHINVPTLFGRNVSDVIAWASGVGLFMSLMTTQSKPKIDDDGSVYKETNPEKLPFTAKNELKQAVKAEDKL